MVNIAPGSGGAAKIFPHRKQHPARAIISANLVFISVLVCLSYFLIPGGPFPWRSKTCVVVQGGRCCDRSGGNFDLEWYSPTLYGNSGMKFSGTVLMSASFLT